jgi:hypothetical protein
LRVGGRGDKVSVLKITLAVILGRGDWREKSRDSMETSRSANS